MESRYQEIRALMNMAHYIKSRAEELDLGDVPHFADLLEEALKQQSQICLS